MKSTSNLASVWVRLQSALKSAVQIRFVSSNIQTDSATSRYETSQETARYGQGSESKLGRLSPRLKTSKNSSTRARTCVRLHCVLATESSITSREGISPRDRKRIRASHGGISRLPQPRQRVQSK